MRFKLLLVAMIAAMGSVAQAETVFVAADGSGDYATIADAVAALPDGGTIELGGGIFSGDGNRDVVLSAHYLISGTGSAEMPTVLDCDGHRAFVLQGGSLFGIGLTIQGGQAERGGAILAAGGSVELFLCRFEDNSADQEGGAIAADGGDLHLTSCEFVDNSASQRGASIVMRDGLVWMQSCSFVGPATGAADCIHIENDSPSGATSWLWDCSFTDMAGRAVDMVGAGSVTGRFTRCGGGAVRLVGTRLTPSQDVGNCEFIDCTGGPALEFHAFGSTMASVEDCLFVSSDPGSADLGVITLYGEGGSVTGCTFVDCAGTGGVVRGYSGDGPSGTGVIERCIIAGGGAEPVRCGAGYAFAVSCCDIVGGWTGCIAEQLGVDGNIDADPLFCDPLQGDYTLRSDSPCLEEANGCGLMGKLALGCEVTTGVAESSLSAIRALY